MNTPQLYLLTYFVRRYVVDVSPELAATRIPHDPHAVVRGRPTVQPIRSIDEVPLCATVGTPGWNHPTWTVAQWATAGREQAAKRLQIVRQEQARLAEEAAEIERALGGEPQSAHAAPLTIQDAVLRLTEENVEQMPHCYVDHAGGRLRFYTGLSYVHPRNWPKTYEGFPLDVFAGSPPPAPPVPQPAPPASIDNACEALTKRMRHEYPWCSVGHDGERLHFYTGTTRGGERRVMHYAGFAVEWHIGGAPISASAASAERAFLNDQIAPLGPEDFGGSDGPEVA